MPMITMGVNPASTGTVTPVGQKDAGSVVNITATPRSNYQFKNWTATAGTFGDANSASTTYTVPNTDATVTANFEISVYRTLTTAVYPTGSGTVTSTSLVEVGTSKQLTASPTSGYVFDRWISNIGVFTNPNSSTTTFTMPDEDVSVYATFKPSGDILHAGRYNSTNYDPVIPMYYDGTNWIECDFKYYNGANWVDAGTL